jgi:hypothetical protein
MSATVTSAAVHPPVTPAQLEAFRAALQDWISGVYVRADNHDLAPSIELMVGPKYARIVRVSPGERSAYGFIDLATGDLLKSDGWKKPAKGVRGNMFAANPLAGCTAYGMQYFR